MANLPKFLSPKEVSKLLGMSEKWVRMRCSDGFFEALKLGKNWRKSESSVQDFLKKNLEESKKIQLAHYAQSLKTQKKKEILEEIKEERSLVMNGRKSRLPDRLSLVNRGYYLRKYPPSKTYPDGNEAWIIWFMVEGENGKEKRKTETVKFATNANEVMDYLEHRRRELFDSNFQCPNCHFNLHTGEQEEAKDSRVSFKQICIEFLKTKKKKRSFKSIRSKVNVLSRYLEDVKGIEEVNSMKRAYRLKEQMEEEGYKGSTFNAYRKKLSEILNFAKDMGYIKEVISLSRIRADEDDSEERRFVPADIFWAIYDKVEPQYLKDMLIIGRTCGNRPNELVTLTWDRVELNGKDSWFYIPKEIEKTHTEKYCSISKEVRPIFERLKKENSSKFVFTYNGNPLNGRNRYSEDLKKANEEVGIEKNYDFYEMCRHSGLTDKGHTSGISLAELMAFAGHKNPATTARYLHAREGKDKGVTQEEIAKRAKR